MINKRYINKKYFKCNSNIEKNKGYLYFFEDTFLLKIFYNDIFSQVLCSFDILPTSDIFNGLFIDKSIAGLTHK